MGTASLQYLITAQVKGGFGCGCCQSDLLLVRNSFRPHKDGLSFLEHVGAAMSGLATADWQNLAGEIEQRARGRKQLTSRPSNCVGGSELAAPA